MYLNCNRRVRTHTLTPTPPLTHTHTRKVFLSGDKITCQIECNLLFVRIMVAIIKPPMAEGKSPHDGWSIMGLCDGLNFLQ